VPKNLIQHIEWTTRSSARLRAFYEKIFDWTFGDAMPGYTLINGVGGIFDAPDPAMPIVITPYVNVADLRATEKKVTAAGGQIFKSRQEVPGRGWFTLFGDPDGNVIGLWEALMPARKTPPKKRVAKKASAEKSAKKSSAKRRSR
jgi:predicted enzyme related to lactoylglutathione lyase